MYCFNFHLSYFIIRLFFILFTKKMIIWIHFGKAIEILKTIEMNLKTQFSKLKNLKLKLKFIYNHFI